MTLSDIVEAATKLIQSAKFEEAENLLKKTPGIENNAAAQQLMGIIAFQTNRAAEAVIYFETAAHELTEDGYLQNNLGQAYKLLGNLNRATQAFEKAAQLQVEFADPLNYLGLLLRQEGSLKQAETAFAAAISRRPGYAEALFNMGALMQDQNRLEDARVYYQLALQAKPSYAQAINNLGTVFDDLGDHTAAERTFREGLEVSPETPELYVSLGSCLRQQAKYIEACAEFSKAVEIEPNFSEVKWNLGFLQLAMADDLDGWANYRYRHSVDREQYPLPTERLADDLTGQQIELAAEQGLGDEIFFLRFAEELIQRGASVTYRPDSKIETLIGRLDGIRIGGLSPKAISIADLPYLLGSDAAVRSIEIQPDADRQAKMQARLAAVGPAPYIGITYRAGGAGKDTLIKNAPLKGIGAALSEIKATFIDVQRLPQSEEQTQLAELLGRRVHDFSGVNDDLEDALALMALLDDYVGVSNTNMHLRAVAGRSARVLVTHPGEYRWQVEGGRSPWFPDFQLYRQAVDGDWQGAFTELSSDIKAKYE